MIIVTITESEKTAAGTIRNSSTADIVELRLDAIGPCDFARLINEAGKPVIVACRREVDGGEYTGGEEERLKLLRDAADAGAAYVDIEVDAAEKIGPLPGGVKKIVSFHDITATPPGIEEVYESILSHRPDVAKIAATATRPGDMLKVLGLLNGAPVPTIAISMGDIGIASRILGRKFGAFATYASPDAERSGAPGQIPLADLVNIYRYRKVSAETRVYGLIGDPVSHSYGPLYHNRAFSVTGMDAVYLPFRIVGEPGNFLSDFRKVGLEGASVTHPFKAAFNNIVEELDDTSRELGHINTLGLKGDGWRGFNTDAPAIQEVLDEFIQDPMLGFTAVVLGAGGAARAACMVLKEYGAKVIVAARNKDKGKRFALEMNVEFVPLRDVGKVDALLMINATPVGMLPNILESPVSKTDFKTGRYVWDFIYNPRKTRFLREAEAAHCVTLSGLSVFVAQARLQQQIWTGRIPPDIQIV